MDACPTDAKAITDPAKCEEAAKAFGYVWEEALGSETGTPICHYCTGCASKVVKLSSGHGDGAYWMCKKTAGNVLFILIDEGDLWHMALDWVFLYIEFWGGIYIFSFFIRFRM